MHFTPIWIITICLYCVCVSTLAILAKFTAKPVDSYNFSFKRMFPFEVINHSERSLPYRIFLCIFVAVSFAPLFNLFTSYEQIVNVEALSIAICCVFGLASICFAFLHYFDATHTLAHLSLFVVFLCLTLLGNALAAIKGFTVFNVLANHNQQFPVLLVGGGICALCSICAAIVSINPRLKNWANLQKVEDTYSRPKIFILAFSEWITFFLLAIGEASYFLITLVH